MGKTGQIIGGALAFVGLAMGGWVGAGIFLAGQAISYLSRPKTPNVSQRQQGVQQQVSSTEASLPVVYGETLVGACVLDIRTDASDNRSLAVVCALALAGESGVGCGDIAAVYLDGRLAINAPVYEGEPVTGASIQAPWRTGGTYGTNLWLQYGAHSGADAQVADSEILAQLGTYSGATDIGAGLQYIVLWLFHNPAVYPTGIPQVTAKVRGVQVLDPRNSTTTWQNGQNPILAARDFMLSKRYGMGLTTADIDSASVTSEANYCDELVSIPGGGTQPRYRCNGFVDPAESPQDNLDRILATCRGRVVEENGKYKFVIRRSKSAESFELTENNIVDIAEFVRGGVKECPNMAIAVFPDAAKNYQPEEAPWPGPPNASNAYITADNGQLHEVRIELPLCSNYYQAQQTAQVLLKEARADAGCVLTATRAALALAHGDRVQVTHSTPGWTQKSFWVEAIGLMPDSGEVLIALQEYDDTAYTLTALATEDAVPGTSHPDPFTQAAPSSLAFTSGDSTALYTREGSTIPRIRLTWVAPSPAVFLDHYIVQYKRSADSTWLTSPVRPSRGDLETFIDPVSEETNYDVRIYAVNVMGVESTQVSLTNQFVPRVTTFPGSPQNPVSLLLAGYWPMDEGSNDTIFDRSTNNRHRRPVAGSVAVARAQGVLGRSINCVPSAGTGLAYELLTDAEEDPFSALYYVCGWFFCSTTSGSSTAVLVSRDRTQCWAITLDQSEAFPQDMQIVYNGNAAQFLDSNDIVLANKWHFFLLQFDHANDRAEFWFGTENGQLSLLQQVNNLAAWPAVSRSIVMGTGFSGGVPSPGTEEYTGLIDEVRIGNQWLTETQVRALFMMSGDDGAPSPKREPWVQAQFAREDLSTTATLTLTIRDPHACITAVEFSMRQGSQDGDVFGSWLSGANWGSAPTPPPYDGDWVKAIDVPGGEESAIKWRVTFTDEDGVSRTIGGTHYTSQIDEHTGEYTLHAADALPETEAYTWINSLGMLRCNATTSLIARQSVLLPVGVTLTEFRARMYRDAGTEIASCTLFRVEAETVTSLSVLTASTGGWATQADTGLSESVTDARSYYIQWVLNPDTDINDVAAGWAKFTYVRHTNRERI